MIRYSLLLLLLLFAPGQAVPAKEAVYKPGEIPNQPVRINKENFESMLQDKTNPLWLLKFYAPWCGHCKRLAPILTKVAQQTAGQMAIGKIDCTSTGAPLCKQFDVKGYPTLMFALDGEVQDFPYGRSQEELVAFAKKMNTLTVDVVASQQDADQYARTQTSNGIVFVAYDPASANAQEISDKLNTSPSLQTYATVARKEQAFAHFLLLEPSLMEGEEGPSVVPAAFGDFPSSSSFFVCRREVGVPTRCMPTDADLQAWVRANNIPTVNDLGPTNFYSIGHKGRPLVIGVYHPEVEVASGKDPETDIKDRLLEFAIANPLASEYYFGYMNGHKWTSFLEQFNVMGGPQVFVLDVPTKTYWQDEKLGYDLDIEGLLKAKASGAVAGLSARRKGVDGIKDMIADWVENNLMAASIITLVFLLVLYVSLAYWASSEDVPVSAEEALLAAEQEANAEAAAQVQEEESKKNK
ncbi:thioredoxin domain-containing protein 10 [Fistulifera solaris]|uniref:Thioredoxin domain-containing protein 10 n=1 Tax=Fistulifera solaris TaxID=1519565 RepID=A0A1Z5K6N5_FISSO|nr:thioredoxin domain-containing protein 10 [Fistulifera solaris]|eukprot:GAX21751.1 thioredoxin domain-containing protein 10 [Fistulifera solaris]